jgi:hypothetical protein
VDRLATPGAVAVQLELNGVGLLVPADHHRIAGRAHWVGSGEVADERIRGQALDSDVAQAGAWSGTGPITNVEVSVTGEGDWHPAQVEPPRGPYQWQDWSFAWEATERGRYSLRARRSG